MDWSEINRRWVKPGGAAWRSGRFDEARQIFEDGLQMTNGDGFIALVFGQMLEDLGDVSEAKLRYEHALSKLPLEKYRAQAREGLRRLSVQVQPGELDGSLPLNPSFQQITKAAAEAREQMIRDRKAGEARFQEILRRLPDDGMVYYNRALAYETLRENHLAASDYRQANVLFPAEHWKTKASEGLRRVLD